MVKRLSSSKGFAVANKKCVYKQKFLSSLGFSVSKLPG